MNRRNDSGFDAFISYAHEDKATATWLERLLRSYWIPRKQARRIFRDETHLTAEGGLSDRIKKALDESKYLVVLASSSAAASTWVPLEIQYFLDRPSVPR